MMNWHTINDEFHNWPWRKILSEVSSEITAHKGFKCFTFTIKVSFIEINTFKQFVQDNGKFAYEIIIELCKDEINLFKKCINKSQKNARGRIADSLLFFKEEIYNDDSFKLPLTRSELGNYVDATRESVSRILTEFNNEKIIKVNGRNVSILNEKLLNVISKTG